jgi:putative hydrolase of the HAD superfamily
MAAMILAGIDNSIDISVLFLDTGGVLLTNGWDRAMRRRAAEGFDIDLFEIDERHHLTFDTYERGVLRLDDYLGRVVFYQPSPSTADHFKEFMFAQSQALDGSMGVFKARDQDLQGSGRRESWIA